MELTKLRPRNAANYQAAASSTSSSQSTAIAGHQQQQQQQPSDEVVILEREILPNDTLQSFSLMYNCNVNDIKRANNLISEQDFFALKKLKIPVKKYGLLTDGVEEKQRRNKLQLMTSNINNSSTSGKADMMISPPLSPSSEEGDFSSDEPLLGNLRIAKDASRFLKSVDKQIRSHTTTAAAGVTTIGNKNQVLEEVVASLGSIGYRPLSSPRLIRRTTDEDCDGSNWGCKWSTLLITGVGLFVFFAFIIAYEYLAEQEKELSHLNSTVLHN